MKPDHVKKNYKKNLLIKIKQSPGYPFGIFKKKPTQNFRKNIPYPAPWIFNGLFNLQQKISSELNGKMNLTG